MSCITLGLHAQSGASYATPDEALSAGESFRTRQMTDSAFYAAEEALRLSQASQNDSLQARSYLMLGLLYFRQGDLETADSLYHAGRKIVKEEDHDQLGKFCYLAGFIAFYRGDFGAAKEAYVEAAGHFESVQNYQELAGSLNNLSIAYHELNDPAREIETLQRVLTIEREHGDSAGVARTLLNLTQCYYDTRYYDVALEKITEANLYAQSKGSDRMHPYIISTFANLYAEIGRCDTAITLYRKAQELSPENPDIQAMCESGILSCYMDMEDYEKAYPYAQRALAWAQQSLDKSSELQVQMNYGNILLQLNRLPEAEEALKKAESMSESLDILDLRLRIQELLTDLYSKQENWELALGHLTEAHRLKDSLSSREREEIFAELSTRFETQQVDKENELLRRENELKEVIIDRQTLLNYATVGGILLLAIIFVLTSYNQRRLKRTNALLDEQKKELEAQQEQLREANRQLLQLNENREKLIAIIAHDLRGPVGSLHQLLQIAQEELEEGEDIREILETGRKASESARDLLLNLLEWAQEKQGLSNYEPRKISMQEIAEQLLDLMQPLAGRKDIRLSNEVGPDVWVYADENMLKTILRNLISNAIKFTHAEGRVTISSKAFEDTVQVCVSDTGVGMTTAQIAAIYEDSPTQTVLGTRREKGTGLGLRLCRELINRWGGSFEVKSTPGKGSAFCFTLESPPEDPA